MLDTFTDSVAVVTGGASGIGRGIALEVAGRGAHVAIADIHEERLAETVADIERRGVEALGVVCDVTSDSSVDAFRDAVMSKFGRVDLLCNNAGVAVIGPPERVLMEDWEWILQVNVLGIVRGVRAFVPAMLERRRGHVVNTASIAGFWAYTWSMAPYITSKFAAYGLTEVMARRLVPHGIGVSALCPGVVATNLGETARASGIPEGMREAWSYVRTPEEATKVADPADVGVLVADAVLSDRFAIFTNDEDAERYRTWREDIEKSLSVAIADSPPPPVLP